jgi:hypothetical protein
MKKEYWIIGIVVLVIAGYFIYNQLTCCPTGELGPVCGNGICEYDGECSADCGDTPGYTIETNHSLTEKYPAVDYYWDHELEGLTNFTIGESVVLFDTKTGSISCDGREVEPMLYEHSYPNDENIDGGWGDLSIIDCNDFYLVFKSGDAGLRFYGPFDIEDTSD